MQKKSGRPAAENKNDPLAERMYSTKVILVDVNHIALSARNQTGNLISLRHLITSTATVKVDKILHFPGCVITYSHSS